MGGALHPPIKLIQIRHIVSASITRGADACRHPERGLRAIGSELVAASLGIANQTMRTGDVQKLGEPPDGARLAMFRGPVLSASLAMSALAVIMHRMLVDGTLFKSAAVAA